MNVNVLDRATLLDAMEHPEDYPQLTIRVSGYAVNFVRLTREQQLRRHQPHLPRSPVRTVTTVTTVTTVSMTGTVTASARTPAPTGVRGSVHSWDLSTGVDGPGTRFVVFLAGCPLRCPYCHNPDTWRMRDGEWVTSGELLERMDHYRQVLEVTHGGVTVSGGEPLLQPSFTKALLVGAAGLGLHTALDTSGLLGARADDELLDATSLVLLDIKSFDPAVYRDLTRGPLRPTLDFAERLAARGTPTWVRFVLVPGWTDAPDHVRRLAEYVAGLGNVERVDVLGYHRLGREKYARLGIPDRLSDVPAASPDLLADVRAVLEATGLTVT